MARKFNAGYYFSEGVHSIFPHGFMSFAAVCMIVACLLIMGSFSLLAVNLNHMLGDLEKENEFLAYVDDSYSEEEARALQSQIEAVPNVSQVTFVSKEEALNQFLEGREHNDLLDSMPATVLRDRYRIHVDDIEQMEQTTKLVEQVPGVAKVNAAIAIAQALCWCGTSPPAWPWCSSAFWRWCLCSSSPTPSSWPPSIAGRRSPS